MYVLVPRYRGVTNLHHVIQSVSKEDSRRGSHTDTRYFYLQLGRKSSTPNLACRRDQHDHCHAEPATHAQQCTSENSPPNLERFD